MTTIPTEIHWTKRPPIRCDCCGGTCFVQMVGHKIVSGTRVTEGGTWPGYPDDEGHTVVNCAGCGSIYEPWHDPQTGHLYTSGPEDDDT